MKVCRDMPILPENRAVPDTEILAADTEIAENYTECSINNQCMIEWIEKK